MIKTKNPKHIGITLGLRKDNESMWVNGIKQNAIFLQNLLQKCGHKVSLLDTSSNVECDSKDGRISDDKIIWDSKKYPIYKFNKHAHKCDIIILLGTTLSDKSLSGFKTATNGKRIVKYQCGNNYVIEMERMLFDKSDHKLLYKSSLVDECWYVPQQGYQNHHYYRVLMNLPEDKVKAVPFVWDPMFIDAVESFYDKRKNVPVYQPKENKDKKLCVMEPNMNVVKMSTIPLLIIEDAYNKYNIDYLYTSLISSVNLAKKTLWQHLVNGLNSIKKTIKTAHRMPVHSILANHADVVISHQWENPLNYAYLDAMYLQFPLIHNAEMIKDAGYYYPEFDVSKGAEQLKWVLDNHDSNIDSYNERNEEVLTRYTVYNEDMLKTYNKLIDNLMAGTNIHHLSYEYDWKTNTYKD